MHIDSLVKAGPMCMFKVVCRFDAKWDSSYIWGFCFFVFQEIRFFLLKFFIDIDKLYMVWSHTKNGINVMQVFFSLAPMYTSVIVQFGEIGISINE